jgi:hypothetical protein
MSSAQKRPAYHGPRPGWIDADSLWRDCGRQALTISMLMDMLEGILTELEQAQKRGEDAGGEGVETARRMAFDALYVEHGGAR